MPEISADAFATMIAHMNDDHTDAVVAYARYYGGVSGVDTARIESMDERGIIVSVVAGSDQSRLPIAFDHELVDADDGRDTLIAMYVKASAPPLTADA
jgi:putative heme iron utilization protein